MTTSDCVAAIRGSSASMNSAASATVLCIFQLAARYGVRSGIAQSLHSRQFLSLKQLQRCSSSGREPVHFVTESELLQRSDGITATNHGRAGCRRDGLGD